MKLYLFTVLIFYCILHAAIAQNVGTTGLLDQFTNSVSGLQPEKDMGEKFLDLAIPIVPDVLGMKKSLQAMKA